MQSVVVVIEYSNVFHPNYRTVREFNVLIRHVSTEKSQVQASLAAGFGLEIYLR